MAKLLEYLQLFDKDAPVLHSMEKLYYHSATMVLVLLNYARQTFIKLYAIVYRIFALHD